MKALTLSIAVAGVCLALATGTWAQTMPEARDLQEIPAVSGHEERLTAEIKRQLSSFSPITDNAGNVYVTIGHGTPHRLIAMPIDEPGYVVSEITEAGYLRVQRLPQMGPNSVFDSLQFAQPVWVMTRGGKEVPGVFAGLSVHLQPGRVNAPKMNHVEELYVDIGAANAGDVRAAGVDVLDPISLQRNKFTVGNTGFAGPAIGDRFDCSVLLQLLARMKESKAVGTTTIAFVTEQWIGGRGLNRLLTELNPDELLFVGRISPAPLTEKDVKLIEPKPGSGVLLGAPADAKDGAKALANEFKTLAEREKLSLQLVNAIAPRIGGYAAGAPLPERTVELGIPILSPITPGEFVNWNDAGYLERLLEAYLDIPKATGRTGSGGGVGGGGGLTDLGALVESYGASGHEAAVREEVKKLLPEWARKKVTTDAAGNLVLHWGDGKHDAKTPSIAFVAHMDELGFEVKKIEDDGRLLAESLGGGYPQYFLGHVALVHKKDGTIPAE